MTLGGPEWGKGGKNNQISSESKGKGINEDSTNAIYWYKKAAEQDNSIAYLNLGNILRDLGQLEEAELSTRKAIELKPDFVDAYSNLANISIREKKYRSKAFNFFWKAGKT